MSANLFLADPGNQIARIFGGGMPPIPCMQLKISISASQLKRHFMPSALSHDVESLKLLTRLRVKFIDLREHRFRHNFRCNNSPTCFFADKGLRTMNTFSCTATDIGLLGRLSLTASPAPLTLPFKLSVLKSSK